MAQTPIHVNQGGSVMTIEEDGALNVVGNSAISDIDTDADAAYNEVEMQTVMDTINDILAALRVAGIIPTA